MAFVVGLCESRILCLTELQEASLKTLAYKAHKQIIPMRKTVKRFIVSITVCQNLKLLFDNIGYFMVALPERALENDQAGMESPIFGGEGPYCLKFFYDYYVRILINLPLFFCVSSQTFRL